MMSRNYLTETNKLCMIPSGAQRVGLIIIKMICCRICLHLITFNQIDIEASIASILSSLVSF